MTTTIEYTPLLYQNPLTPAPCHSVDLSTGKITALNDDKPANFYKTIQAAYGCLNERALQELLRGCSSINTFSDNKVIVTTNAVPMDGDYAIRVSLTVGADFIGPEFLFQIRDDGDQASRRRVFLPVFVEAFLVENDRIQINVVDEFGKVVILHLTVKEKVLVLASNEAHVMQLPTLECHHGARLSASGCTWLSSQILLFAMSPKLISCDVVSGLSVEWELSGGINASWRITRRMSSMLTPGKSRTPTLSPAAIVCKSKIEDAGSFVLFTLHADGSIIKWNYTSDNLDHSGARLLDESGWPMDDWSPTNDAVKLTCRTYLNGQRYVLGMMVKSKLIDPSHRGCIFWSAIVHGFVTNDNPNDVFVELNQARNRPDLDTIVSLDFVDSPRISLQCLFSTYDGSSVLLMFEPSQVGLICVDPIVSNVTNSISLKRRNYDDEVAIKRFISNNEPANLSHIEKVMMRRIFRPMRSFKPSPSNVFRALLRVLPSQLQNLVLKSDGLSNEAKVLMSLRSWNRLSKEASSKKMAISEMKTSSADDIYEAFTQTAESITPSSNDALTDYFSNWVELEQAILEEERWMYWPLALKFSGSEAFLVQSTVVASISFKASSEASAIDSSAVELLSALLHTDTKECSIINQFESRIEYLVSTARILFDEESTLLFDDLQNLSDQLDVNNMHRLKVVQDMLQHFKDLFSSVTQEQLEGFLSSTLLSLNPMDDRMINHDSFSGNTHENIISAHICALQLKLEEAAKVGLARCILLPKNIHSSEMKSLVKNLAQVKSSQFIISNISPKQIESLHIYRKATDDELSNFGKSNIASLVNVCISEEKGQLLPPEFALRAFAPIVAFEGTTFETNSEIYDIKEKLALHMVEEWKTRSVKKNEKELLRALDLYFESDMSHIHYREVGDFTPMLNFLVEHAETFTYNKSDEINSEELAQAVNHHASFEDEKASTKVANIPTLRRLLSPFLRSENYIACLEEIAIELDRRNLPSLSQFFALFSSLQHGLQSLQYFGGCAFIGLDCVNRVVGFVEKYFPIALVRQMPEIATLYSAALEFALSSSKWEAGFEACKSQPERKRKISGFTRLVEAMVIKGYIRELIGFQLVPDVGVDWFQLAVVAIEEKCRRKSDSNDFDWCGSLYALLVSRRDWRSAAHVIYKYSDIDANLSRRSLSHLAAENALRNVWNTSRQFIAKMDSYEIEEISLRLADEGMDTKVEGILTVEDICTKALFSSCIPYLIHYHESIHNASEEEVIDLLASSGYILQAICLAKRIYKEHPHYFYDKVRDYICNFIAPLTSPIVTTATPTNRQLHFMRIRTSRFTNRSSLSMCVLEMYTSAFANSNNNIAICVAETLLTSANDYEDLPIWLTSLLTGGDSSVEGLFASRSLCNPKADPAALLRLLIRFGFYIQACHLVSTVLANPKRRDIATSRVPEKGGIDYVPYDDIDMLWKISGKAVTLYQDPKFLISARNKMARSLEQHFNWAKLSKDSLTSARAIARN